MPMFVVLLKMKRGARHDQCIVAQCRANRVHHLLISEASAVRKPPVIPVQTEYAGGNVNLVAHLRQIVGRTQSVRIVVAEAGKPFRIL